MKLQNGSEICEDVAIRWQGNAIAELNTLLKKHGVTDRDAREEILGTFFFQLAAELDRFTGRGHRIRWTPLPPAARLRGRLSPVAQAARL